MSAPGSPVNHPLSLPGEVTIYTVAECRDLYLAWAAAPAPDTAADEALRVDGSAVEDVDAAGLQLLLALANGLAREQRRLRLANPSEALGRACAMLGAAHLLADAPARVAA
jgi:anti-anti-sigma regulatory factor